jgi:hypothetical protein
MNAQPVILLNIETPIDVLEGLKLYVLADGNDNSQKIDNYESCMKFQVVTTNTTNGDRVKKKFALHGRLTSRKGVSIDHGFVVQRIWDTLRTYLESKKLIISDNAEPGVFMTRAIWRYIFAAGTRVADFANGVGIFSQPANTNFVIGEHSLDMLENSRGSFTLAVSNGKMVKFYLGEDFPLWGMSDEVGEGGEPPRTWLPCKKKVTPAIIDACLVHFVEYINQDNDVLEVFTADKVEDMVDFIKARNPNWAKSLETKPEKPFVERVPVPEEPPVSRGLVSRLKSALMGEELKLRD